MLATTRMMIRSTRASGVSALLCLLVSPSLAGSRVTPRLPSGADLLGRVLRAEESVPYQGIQVFTLFSHGKRTETVSVEYNLGAGHSKIEYVSPSDIRGRVVVNDGLSRWEYNPAENVVIRTPVFRRPVRSSAIKSTISRVSHTYTLVVSEPDKRVAGRRLYRLEYKPRLGDREPKVWWIDRATGLVLRRDVLDAHGQLRQTTAFRSIRYRPPADLSVARYVPANGIKVITRNEAHAVFEFEKSKALLPSWARIPASIGQRFEFDNARVVRNNGIQTVQVQYTDGLVGISLFVSPGAVQPEADTGAVRHVRLGSIRGSVVEPFPPYIVLSWTASGKTYSLVADITEAALVAIARKLL